MEAQVRLKIRLLKTIEDYRGIFCNSDTAESAVAIGLQRRGGREMSHSMSIMVMSLKDLIMHGYKSQDGNLIAHEKGDALDTHRNVSVQDRRLMSVNVMHNLHAILQWIMQSCGCMSACHSQPSICIGGLIVRQFPGRKFLQ